jgi:hypothetical protein
MEAILSGTLIFPVLSFLAVAIFGPLATHLWTSYRERRSLRASLSVHEYPFPIFLKTQLDEQLKAKYTAGDMGKPETKQLETLSDLHGYMKLTLHNPSKKKLNAITVTLKEAGVFGPLHQIEDEPRAGPCS